MGAFFNSALCWGWEHPIPHGDFFLLHSGRPMPGSRFRTSQVCRPTASRQMSGVSTGYQVYGGCSSVIDQTVSPVTDTVIQGSLGGRWVLGAEVHTVRSVLRSISTSWGFIPVGGDDAASVSRGCLTSGFPKLDRRAGGAGFTSDAWIQAAIPPTLTAVGVVSNTV